ncbi:unnamed protein product [Protopolystoma xenopodis]|uniref:Uncharacterized protein n=1 Tax=Protopolystoma xenopodis TaxID=117903 RepID=A0A3S5CK56_9PLAT|nr:unnamed protein product [Protopolystoma xenopodis]
MPSPSHLPISHGPSANRPYELSFCCRPETRGSRIPPESLVNFRSLPLPAHLGTIWHVCPIATPRRPAASDAGPAEWAPPHLPTSPQPFMFGPSLRPNPVVCVIVYVLVCVYLWKPGSEVENSRILAPGAKSHHFLQPPVSTPTSHSVTLTPSLPLSPPPMPTLLLYHVLSPRQYCVFRCRTAFSSSLSPGRGLSRPSVLRRVVNLLNTLLETFGTEARPNHSLLGRHISGRNCLPSCLPETRKVSLEDHSAPPGQPVRELEAG